MISISIFRINAKNRTIWYNLIQTSVPLVYTNYFYNIYCPNMGGSRGGDRALQVLHKRVNLQTQFLKYEPCWHDIQ